MFAVSGLKSERQQVIPMVKSDTVISSMLVDIAWVSVVT